MSGKVIHRQGSLFDALKGSDLVHACNCQGVWGSGIAKEFAKRFPETYKTFISDHRRGSAIPGGIFEPHIPENDYGG